MEAKRIFKKREKGVSQSEAKKFQDYIFRLLIEKAPAEGLPIQIHTGMQFGNMSMLKNSNPLYLNNLFIEYPDAKFDLLHGYPFSGEVGVLANNFPNVYVDACWLPIISPAIARDALSQWVELVPSNKILWGGDVRCVEMVYGAVLFARDVITEVLAEKVSRNYFDEDDAIEVALKILRENAIELYLRGKGYV